MMVSKMRVIALAAALVLIFGACSQDGKTDVSSPSGDDLNISVASYDVAVGEQRFIVGLQLEDNRLVSYGKIPMVFSFLGTREDQRSPERRFSAEGSFLPIPLEETEQSTPPDGEREQPSAGPASHGRGVYAANATFDEPGFWEVSVSVDIEGEGRKKGTGAFEVLQKHLISAVGDAALRTENLTTSSADAPRAAIDSRGRDGEIPDPELHQTTIAHALDVGRPALVVFSTPVFCVSRFCGPITDMVQGLASQYSDRAYFIHVEVWRDFAAKEVNKAAADWLYRESDLTEPWVFLIGPDAKIAARWDNVATRDEIEPLLKAFPPSQAR